MPLKPTPDDALQLNLTPMIDVVFLLVIFFMAATQFAEVERAVELRLPEVPGDGASIATVTEPSVVSVTADGVTALDGRELSLEELTGELTSAASDRPDLEVLIHGDGRCDFQHIASALAACRAAGVVDVGVTVEVAAQPDALRR